MSIYMKEDRILHSHSSKKPIMTMILHQLSLLYQSIRIPLIWKSALWIFLSGATSPGLHQINFYYATDVLHFTPNFMAVSRAAGYLFLMVGTVFYNSFFRATRFRIILYYAQVALSIVSLLDIVLVMRWNLRLGIPDQWFFLGDEVISDIVCRLKSMPVLVLCNKICPETVEGTLFALLMSITNLSSTMSSYWGAILCHWIGISKDNYDNLWLAILIRSIFKIIPIFFLSLIPDVSPQEEIKNLRHTKPNIK